MSADSAFIISLCAVCITVIIKAYPAIARGIRTCPRSDRVWRIKNRGDQLWRNPACQSLKRLENIRLSGYTGAMKKTAQIFKALSDETRLRILSLLARGELCVCDLMAILDLPQSTVSRHLAYLRNAGLVEDRRQGVWMFYRLAREEGEFRQEVQSLLQPHLAALPQGQADRIALEAYFVRKEDSACG